MAVKGGVCCVVCMGLLRILRYLSTTCVLNTIRDLLQYLVYRASGCVYLPNTYFGGGVQPSPRVSPLVGGGRTRADTCDPACVGVSCEMQIWVRVLDLTTCGRDKKR